MGTDNETPFTPSLAVGGEYVMQASPDDLPMLVRVTSIENDKATGCFYDAALTNGWDVEQYPIDPTEVVAYCYHYERLVEEFVQREMARDGFIREARESFIVERSANGLSLRGPHGEPLATVGTKDLTEDDRSEAEAAFASIAHCHTRTWITARVSEWESRHHIPPATGENDG